MHMILGHLWDGHLGYKLVMGPWIHSRMLPKSTHWTCGPQNVYALLIK